MDEEFRGGDGKVNISTKPSQIVSQLFKCHPNLSIPTGLPSMAPGCHVEYGQLGPDPCPSAALSPGEAGTRRSDRAGRCKETHYPFQIEPISSLRRFLYPQAKHLEEGS